MPSNGEKQMNSAKGFVCMQTGKGGSGDEKLSRSLLVAVSAVVADLSLYAGSSSASRWPATENLRDYGCIAQYCAASAQYCAADSIADLYAIRILRIA